MAEADLLRRAVFRNPAAAISCLFREANRFLDAASYSSSTSVADERSPGSDGDDRGKWLTLPPFTPTVDGPELGRKIAGRRMEAAASVSPTSTTALKWVLRCCPELPRSLVQKLFRLRQVRRECCDTREERVKVEGPKLRLKRVTAKDSMNQGDKIFLPIVAPSPKKNQYDFNQEELDFISSLVLYKDSSIIAINKPPGLPVQGGVGIRMSLDEVAASCFKYEYSESPKLVHRLDRDCSGILVMGRTQTSTTILHSVFHEKTAGASDDGRDNGKRFLQKRYLALVFGSPRCLKGTIDVPLKKVLVDDGKSERITIGERSRSSQHAVTEYRVIETTPFGYTWLELSPLTGRKHQLRVHCAEVLRTPIVGDYKYGWQAHRQWRPFPGIQTSHANKFQTTHLLESGSITEKQPGLHLHCKQMILPNISLAIQQASEDANFDFSNLETVSLVAPLPWHMQRSWDILNSLAEQKSCESTIT
ncbi:hypothetical protein V2J09_002092 [Rumex salicifolius]